MRASPSPPPAHSISMDRRSTVVVVEDGLLVEPSSRSKHIEVCVRLRPLHVQGDTSSASFLFHKPAAAPQQQRPQHPHPPPQPQQPYAHRPPAPTTNNNNNNTKLASKLPSFMRSTKAGRRTTTRTTTDMDTPSTEPPPLSHNNHSATTNNSPQQPHLVVPNEMIYAWDVMDRDTVTQSPRTELVPGRTHTYTLDAVYGASITTQQLYDASVRDLVRAALEGYHTAVLAYGQTSTGACV